MSLRSALFIFIGFVLLAALGAGFFLWRQASGGENLTIELETPLGVRVGAPFDVDVQVRNDSGTVLKDAEFIMELPSGMVFVGGPSERSFLNKSIGDLGAGGLYHDTVKLMVLDGAGSVKRATTRVSYQPQGISSRFEKEQPFVITVEGEAMRLELTAPEKTFSGEEIELKVSYQNVSGDKLSGLELQIDYPPAFTVSRTSLPADFNNTIWTLGELATTGKNELSIRGTLAGPEGSFYGFRVRISANFSGRLYTVAEKSVNITLTQSPLSIEVKPSDDLNYIVRPGDGMHYTLSYRNNTEVGLRDVIVRAKLIGELFDLTSVGSDGFLRFPDNAVVWTAANTPALALLPPGASGQVEFEIDLRPEYPIRRFSDKNFMLKVEAEIESPTVPPFVGASRTIGKSSVETKVGGRFTVDARGFFRDAPSGILNNGPLPPVVGRPTQFTIHWVLWNYATDISNVEFRSSLGGNVRFTGEIKSNTGVLPEYNDRTQEIVWHIDKVPATKGISDGKPLEAIFQVELTPGVNQVGQTPVLVQDLKAHATDDFTGETLTADDTSVETSLPDDTTVQDGTVIP